MDTERTNAERSVLGRLLAGNRRWLGVAALLAMLAAAASVGLVAVSGWFLTASAIAGAAAAVRLEVFLPAAAIRALAVLRTLGRYLERLVSHEFIFRGITRLRDTLFRGFAARPMPELEALGDDRAVNRLLRDAERLEAYHAGIWLPFLGALFASLLLVVLAAWLVSGATALVVATTGVLLALVVNASSGRSGRSAIRLDLRRDHANRRLGALLDGYRELHHLDPDRHLGRALADDFRRIGQQQTELARRAGGGEALGGLILIAGVGVILVLAASLAPQARPEGLEWAPRIALLSLGLLATGAVWAGLHEAWQRRPAVRLAARRLHRDLPDPHAAPDQAGSPRELSPSLQFQGIHLRRGLTGHAVLEELDLDLAPGEWLAITGRSGSGKSSLAGLASGLLAPDRGDVLLGERPLATVAEAERFRTLGIFQQQDGILADTLRRNLELGLGEDGDVRRIREALQGVGLGYLESRLDEWVGPGGRALSGGETRRVGLIRTLLAPARLVVLDEPLRGLDARSRERTLTWLRGQLAGRTLLWLDHAPPPLPLDRVLHLENGGLQPTENRA